MSTEINNTSANSICIPRAFANISEARVRKVFDALNIFTIDRVDMVQRKNEKGDAYQRIFVHIKEWSETADARKAKERLLAGKELKIVYDDPWFWKASLNTWAPKPKSETGSKTGRPSTKKYRRGGSRTHRLKRKGNRLSGQRKGRRSVSK